MSHWQDEIRDRLSELRSAIRRYLLLEGVAVVVVLLGAWFWLTYLVDVGYFGTTRLELPHGLRTAALVVGLGGIALAAGSWLFTRVWRPLQMDSLALLLERKFPEFNGRLMSALRSYVPEGDAAAMMAERNEQEAADRLRDVDVLEVLNPLPLRRWSMAAGALFVSVVVFGATNASGMGRWADAYLRGKTGYWDPFRKTEITLQLIRQPGDVEVAFEDGVAKHARGAHLTLIASVPEGREVPDRVTLTVRSVGSRGEAIDQEIPMTPSGVGRFRHTVLRVVDDLRIDLTGGDYTTTEPYYVDVVDAPRLDGVELVCTFPDYTGLNDDANRVVPVQSNTVELPYGTHVQIQARANKPLQAVRLGGVDVTAAGLGEVAMIDAEPTAWSAEGVVGPLSALRTRSILIGESTIIGFESGEPLEITLTDTDGLTSQQPIELTFLAKRDAAPLVAVQPRGVGTSVTRQARLPFGGTLADDYALNEAWFAYEVRTGKDVAESAKQLLDVDVSGRRQSELDEELSALDLRPLGLAVGQQMKLSIAASDTNDLTGPGIGRSETTSLTIVSDEELLGILYDKELNLRQRFERILEEVTETRDDIRLARDKANNDGDAETWSQLSAAAEQAVLAIRKNDGETRSIVALFRDIRAELVNNRVDTEDMLQRIDRGIVGPLDRILDEDFPESERAIIVARDVTRGDLDFASASSPLSDATNQLDRLVARLQAVLDEMQRRQSYNQLIKELQRLIELQKGLQKKTEEKSVEDLFGDFFE